jgi:hypothetical protein
LTETDSVSPTIKSTDFTKLLKPSQVSRIFFKEQSLFSQVFSKKMFLCRQMDNDKHGDSDNISDDGTVACGRIFSHV